MSSTWQWPAKQLTATQKLIINYPLILVRRDDKLTIWLVNHTINKLFDK